MAGGPNRRPQIIEAALGLFTRHGYGTTSLADMAAAAGVSKSAIAFHIGSKEGLATELSEAFLSELEAVVSAEPPPPWPDGARELFGEYFEVLVRNRPVAVWLDQDMTAPTGAGIRLRATIDRLADQLNGTQGEMAGRVRALAAVGGLWRPLRMLAEDDLIAHRAELIDSALVSFAPLD